MKICCTGHHGHVGKILVDRGVIPLECDVKNIESIRKAIKKASPDVVINCASKTSTEWIAKNQDNYNEALKVNVTGMFLLANACGDIPVIALSTDHIFPGRFLIDWKLGKAFRGGPYKESDKAYPVSDYGLTKLGMEFVADTYDNVKVVRTSNLFWDEDPRILGYLDKFYKQQKVPVPVFQKRSFVHVYNFVDALLEYANNLDKMPKVLHISGSETISWHEFMEKFLEKINFPLRHKLSKKRFDDGRKVARPKSVGLDVSLSAKLGISQFSYLDGLEIL